MILETMFILAMFNATGYDDIFYTMDMYYEHEFYPNQWIKIQLVIVNFDIPDRVGYYSAENERIVIEIRGLQPAHKLPNGQCNSNLWHEILHAKWEDGSDDKGEADHVRMIKENLCA